MSGLSAGGISLVPDEEPTPSDTEMLDWSIQHEAKALRWSSGYQVEYLPIPGVMEWAITHVCDTGRKAIRAAMKAHP